MVEYGTITTKWGYKKTVAYAPFVKVEEGPDYEIWRRANGSYIAFYWDGSKTYSNTGSPAALGRLREWIDDKRKAVEKARERAKGVKKYGGIEIGVEPSNARIQIPKLKVDRHGGFSMANIEPGTYSVIVSYPGYE